MRAIRSKDTKPELIIRKCLHAAGLRYRLGGGGLPGRPDLIFPKYRAVIFVHGCFWHGHNCKFFKVPKTRTEFWLEKIDANKKRDQVNTAKLLALGWNVLIVWECYTRTASQAAHDTASGIKNLLGRERDVPQLWNLEGTSRSTSLTDS